MTTGEGDLKSAAESKRMKDAMKRLKDVPVWRVGGRGYSNPVRVKGLQNMGKDWKPEYGFMLDIEDLPNKDGDNGEWNVNWIVVRYWDLVKFFEAPPAAERTALAKDIRTYMALQGWAYTKKALTELREAKERLEAFAYENDPEGAKA